MEVDKKPKLEEHQGALTLVLQDLALARVVEEVHRISLETFCNTNLEYIKLSKLLTDARETRGDLEVSVRTFVLDIYDELGERRPAKGVEVKMWIRYEYTVEKAQEWTKEHAPVMLVLDKKAFEKYLKTAKYLPDFITVIEEAKASIARKLDDYLPKPSEATEGEE